MKISSISRLLICISALTIFSSCEKGEAYNVGVVPCPNNVTLVSEGSFDRVAGARISCSRSFTDIARNAVQGFANDVTRATGVETEMVSYGKKDIVFTKNKSLEQGEYQIRVTPKRVSVLASTDKGVLNAIATLRQMLPVSIYAGKAGNDEVWTLPCVRIDDKPRFEYRGLLIDCARHFFTTDEVKKLIDIMSVYKLNILHWHLSDDQGWRIQIDKYPALTEQGAWRSGTQLGRDKKTSDGIRHGGFYTKEEIRDIVSYAEARGIEIIPEIDLPGHMLSALSVFPELGCTGGPYEVWTHWGVSPDILCAGKEETFKFLEDVLGEVAELFPSRYFHIGGDECPKTRWKECPDCQARIKSLGLEDEDGVTAEQKLQNYVTSRVQSILAAKGKQIIGWDEILEGELTPGAVVMSWRGAKGGIEAAKRGFQAIMCPYQYFYIDFAQAADVTREALAMDGCLPIEKVYSFEPYDGIPDEYCGNVIGVQTNLWTEYIGSDRYLEYMLLPRLAAASEIQWCDRDNKDMDRFLTQVKEHQLAVYDAMGYNYSKVVLGIFGKDSQDATERFTASDIIGWTYEHQDTSTVNPCWLDGDAVCIRTRANTYDRAKLHTDKLYQDGVYTWKTYIPELGKGDQTSIGSWIYCDDRHEVDFEVGYGKEDVRENLHCSENELVACMTNQAFPFKSEYVAITPGWHEFKIKMDLYDAPRNVTKYYEIHWYIDGVEKQSVKTNFGIQDAAFRIYVSVENLKFIGSHIASRDNVGKFEWVTFEGHKTK